jgi:STE24 endopeptidase
MLNGMEPTRHSWRHGSIAKRVAFVRSLEMDADGDRRFERAVLRHKLVLGLIFIAATAIEVAWFEGAI